MKNRYLFKLQNKWRNCSRVMTLIAVTVALTLSGSAFAQKKPGGGGGGGSTPAPAGTIYFSQSTAEQNPDGYPLYAEMKMAGDGSGKTQTGLTEQGVWREPSHQLHNGQRWFLTTDATEMTRPDGWYLWHLFAVTEGGAREQLTDAPNMSIDFVRWAKDDSFLSFTAYIYEGEEVQAGFFVATVDWSSGSPVVGTPAKVLELSVDSRGYLIENYAHDWSPLGDELVYLHLQRNASGDLSATLEIIRFLAGGATETRSLGPCGFSSPEWAPDGSRIAFSSQGAIWTIQPNGTGAKQLTKATFDRQQEYPSWSPDSKYLAYTEYLRRQKGFQQPTYTFDVMRVSAAGGGITNLTSDTDPDCFLRAWR
jgi:hypothetical protein